MIIGAPRDDLVAVHITWCSSHRVATPGTAAWLSMCQLIEHDCAREVRDDEEARARLAASDRREVTERAEKLVEWARERRIDRGIDRSRGWDISM